MDWIHSAFTLFFLGTTIYYEQKVSSLGSSLRSAEDKALNLEWRLKGQPAREEQIKELLEENEKLREDKVENVAPRPTPNADLIEYLELSNKHLKKRLADSSQEVHVAKEALRKSEQDNQRLLLRISEIEKKLREFEGGSETFELYKREISELKTKLSTRTLQLTQLREQHSEYQENALIRIAELQSKLNSLENDDR